MSGGKDYESDRDFDEEMRMVNQVEHSAVVVLASLTMMRNCAHAGAGDDDGVIQPMTKGREVESSAQKQVEYSQ